MVCAYHKHAATHRLIKGSSTQVSTCVYWLGSNSVSLFLMRVYTVHYIFRHELVITGKRWILIDSAYLLKKARRIKLGVFVGHRKVFFVCRTILQQFVNRWLKITKLLYYRRKKPAKIHEDIRKFYSSALLFINKDKKKGYLGLVVHDDTWKRVRDSIAICKNTSYT